jgi:hypothetical protein
VVLEVKVLLFEAAVDVLSCYKYMPLKFRLCFAFDLGGTTILQNFVC